MNFYEVLGVDPDADQSEIERAYRERAHRVHPDVNDHPEAGGQFRLLVAARDVLTDDEERDAYDRLGHAGYVDERLDGDLPTPETPPAPQGRPTDGPRPKGGRTGGSDADGATPGPETPSGPGPDSPSGAPRGAHSVPPTPGSSDRVHRSRSRPRGPERLREDAMPATTTVRAHATASLRWAGVAAATGVYAAGVRPYLATGRGGLRRLLADLTTTDPTVVAGALRGARYGVPDPLTYALGSGLRAGSASAGGALLLAGAILLPAALAFAVSGLRRKTTWRPSWLHVVGALGPAGAVGLAYGAGTAPGAIPLAPLVADLALLVGCPSVVVASFLLNRFLVVFPLVRREDLTAP